MTIEDCSDANRLCFYNGGRIEISGWVADEPNIKIGTAEYIIRVKNAYFENNEQKLSGRLLIRTLPYPEYQYGERLRVVCNKMLSPGDLDTGTFRYDKYLEKFQVRSVCYNPEIKTERGAAGNFFLRNIYHFKNILREKINLIWTEPTATLIGGILYGGRSGMTEELSEDFRATGLSHIVAVSGYNITIIVVAAMSVLISIGLYREQAYFAVLTFTLMFVFFSGLSASAVRAAIMGMMVLTAKQIGRGGAVFNILIFTAAAIQLTNPYLLIWDAGFQLSFFATIGLVYLSPIITKYLEKFPASLGNVLATTLSAIALTLPIMLYQFGSLSVVAPLTNLLILWILPFIMLAGFSALVISFISVFVARVVGFATYVGLSYVIIVIQYFGSLSWSQVSVKMPLWSVFVSYGLIFYGLYKYYEKNKSV